LAELLVVIQLDLMLFLKGCQIKDIQQVVV
jgi:hypothetical protein